MSDDPEFLDITPLSCGCVVRRELVDNAPIATIIPCRQDCPVFAEALKMFEAAGKLVTFREAP